MMPGPFGKLLRPDEPRGRPKPFTPEGRFIQRCETQMTASLAVAAFACGLGAWGMHLGMAKDAAPPRVLVTVLDRTGQLVATRYLDEKQPLDEAVTRGVLSNLVWKMRRLTPDEPYMAEVYDQNGPYFCGDGAVIMRGYMTKRTWFKPMIARGERRVVELPVNVQRMPGNEDVFRADWLEYDLNANNTPKGQPRVLTMVAKVTKRASVPEDILLLNPQGACITDVSGSFLDS